jgi:hypothetical protein
MRLVAVRQPESHATAGCQHSYGSDHSEDGLASSARRRRRRRKVSWVGALIALIGACRPGAVWWRAPLPATRREDVAERVVFGGMAGRLLAGRCT